MSRSVYVECGGPDGRLFNGKSLRLIMAPTAGRDLLVEARVMTRGYMTSVPRRFYYGLNRDPVRTLKITRPSQCQIRSNVTIKFLTLHEQGGPELVGLGFLYGFIVDRDVAVHDRVAEFMTEAESDSVAGCLVRIYRN